MDGFARRTGARPSQRRRELCRAGLATLFAVPTTAAARRQRVIEQVKSGVVAVGSFQRTRTPPFRMLGTGFAVGDGGLVATNAHVIAPVVDGSAEPEALAALVPGGPARAPQVVELARRAVDAGHDLALLQVSGASLPALSLRERDDVADGDEYLFTGFPIGAVLGPYAATHRAMVAAVTPIVLPAAGDRLDAKTVRQLQRGAFAVYQLDATAYPGNSGSPLYDAESGEVVGIINMVFVKGLKENVLAQPSGISFAIPVRHLRVLLAAAAARPSEAVR